MNDEYVEGYCDGRNPASPEAGPNRSPQYRHSFEIARAELAGKPIPAAISRKRVAEIEAAHHERTAL